MPGPSSTKDLNDEITRLRRMRSQASEPAYSQIGKEIERLEARIKELQAFESGATGASGKPEYMKNLKKAFGFGE